MKQEQEVERIWRDFIATVEKLEKLWEAFSEKAREMPSMEMLDLDVQEVFSRVSIWSEFEVALESMMNYWRSQGGLEVFRLKEKEKVRTTKESKGGKE